MSIRGVYSGGAEVIIAVKAAIMEIGPIISILSHKTVLKDLILNMVLTAVFAGTFHEVSNLFAGGEFPNKGMKAILGFVGISGAAVTITWR